MRLIDADKLETHEQLESLGNGKYEYVEVVYKDDIDNAPTIEPERKRGQWIKNIERFGDNTYHCSQCGAVLEKDNLEWRNNYYCYHCGADMRGGQNE